MARPKKYQSETTVVSFRIPKDRESEIKLRVEQILSNNLSTKKLEEIAKKMEAAVDDELSKIQLRDEYQKELDALVGTSAVAIQRRKWLQNQIYNLNKQLK